MGPASRWSVPVMCFEGDLGGLGLAGVQHGVELVAGGLAMP